MISGINEISTLTGNNLFVVTEITLLAFLLYWMRQPTRVATCKILHAWILVSFAVLIRVGFWSLALMMHDYNPTFMRCSMDMSDCFPSTTVYPDWATDWRGVVTLVSGLLALVGQMIFISYVQGISFITRYALAFFIVIISVLGAFLF